MVKLNAKPKSNVKLQNKQTNKLNKRKSTQRKVNKKQNKHAKKEEDQELKNGVLFSRLNNKRKPKEEAPNNQNDDDDDDDDERLAADYIDNESDDYSNEKPKRKRKVAENEADSIESKYKMKKSLQKLQETNKRMSFALPIKTESGKLMTNFYALDQLDEADKENQQQTSETKTATEREKLREERPKSFAEQLLEKKIFFEKSKFKIGNLSRSVIENPQGEIKKLKELRAMLNDADIRNSFMLKKLIVVSLCQIFKDITPSYKVRLMSQKEKEQKLSKEVAELREFEETLVKQYKLYIDFLSDSLKGVHKNLFKSSTRLEESLKMNLEEFAFISARCLCNLLERLSHFNHANELILLVVHHLTSKIHKCAAICIDTLKKLFSEDKELTLSLEITQKVTKMLKQKSFGVRPDILNIFLELKLKEIQLPDEAKKSKKMTHKEKKLKLSRNERKKQKEKEQLEKDLEEKKVSDRLLAKSKLQARILEQLFTVYFNILKKCPNFKLIPCVLEGLAKFAHLININFFNDLVKLMHELIESERLTLRSKLHCIKTVFVVLSGRAQVLSIDPIKFYTSLYNISLNLSAAGELENTILFSECVEMMFFRRSNQIPSPRLLAFIKRLSSVSLQLEPQSCAIVLHILRKLIHMNRMTDLLFDNEYQNVGFYDPELTEPDYANAQNSALWELHLFRNHYNQIVSSEAKELFKSTSLALNESKITAREIVERVNQDEEKVFNQNIKLKKQFFK